MTKTCIDPKGLSTTYTYDFRGNETSLIKKNASGETIAQTESFYDANGALEAVTHTIFSGTQLLRKVTHKWEYGPSGRKERFLEVGTKETRYLYDTSGRLKTTIKTGGISIENEYDAMGRISRILAPDCDYRYEYDARDRIVALHDARENSTTRRTYDVDNNLIEEVTGNGLGISYAYDETGRKTQCFLPWGTTVSYTYDGLYLYSIAAKGHEVVYEKRNAEGRVEKMRTPTGDLLIDRDPLNRVLSMETPFYLLFRLPLRSLR